MLNSGVTEGLKDLLTLKQIAPRVGSYFTAYSLAAAGRFGPPAAVVGRTQLFAAAVVEQAVAAYLANRPLRRPKPTPAEAEK